jgi:hypothetical protein
MTTKNHDYLLAFLLAAITAAVYIPVRNFEFVSYDDFQYIYGNFHVLQGLSRSTIRWAFTAMHSANWNPLAWISHMLDIELFGLNAGMHHLVSLAFHCANTVLLFFALTALTRRRWPSLFVAALFALHPLHVESVAWVSERKDVLSTFFFLLMLRLYADYARSPTLRHYLLLLTLYLFGLMSKSMLVTVPFVLLCVDIWPLKRFEPAIDLQRYRTVIIEKIPFLCMAIVVSVLIFLAQRRGGAVAGIEQFSIPVRLSNAVISYSSYLFSTLFPHNLSFFYPHPGVVQLWRCSASALFLTAVTGAVIRYYKKFPWLAVGWFWYLITLLPVIGIVQVGSAARTDHFTYIPLTGIFIILAWGGRQIVLFSSRLRPVVIAAAFIAVAGFALLARAQTLHWRDNFSLFSHAVMVNPANPLANYKLGREYAQRGNHEMAVLYFSRSIVVRPDIASVHNDLGVAWASLGRYDSAYVHFKRALELDSTHTGAQDNYRRVKDVIEKNK